MAHYVCEGDGSLADLCRPLTLEHFLRGLLPIFPMHGPEERSEERRVGKECRL